MEYYADFPPVLTFLDNTIFALYVLISVSRRKRINKISLYNNNAGGGGLHRLTEVLELNSPSPEQAVFK